MSKSVSLYFLRSRVQMTVLMCLIAGLLLLFIICNWCVIVCICLSVIEFSGGGDVGGGVM